MRELELHREKLLRDAAEYKLISQLATDRAKQELFARVSDHLQILASELEREIKRRLTEQP